LPYVKITSLLIMNIFVVQMSLPIIVKTMATTIEQQVAMDEAFVPSTQRNMLHICPRVQSQTFVELPFEEEILDFIRFLRHNATIRTLTDGLYHKRNIDYAFWIWEDFVYQVDYKNHKKSNEMYYPRFTKVIIHHFMSKDPSIPRRNKYSAMLPIELTNDEIRNTKAYKEYYAFAIGEAVPKLKASARRKISKQPAKATKAKSPSTPLEVAKTEAQQLKIVLSRSRQQMHTSQPGGSGTDEGTGADDQVNDGDDDEEDEGDESDEGEEDADEDKDGDERDDDEVNQETAKYDEQDDAEGGGNDEEEGSEDEGNGEKDQGLNVNEEEHVEEEEEDKLYRDVNINQGRGLQATLEVKNTHVTLTLINSDGQQESSSVSSQFMTSMLNPTSDVGMESIFVIASSSVAPLHTSTLIMTPSTITTITTISQAPIPPTLIPSKVLQNLPTFASVFCFDDRLKSLEANFSEYRQTNPFAEAVSNIPRIVHQYMNQQMNEAVRVAI
nr:hypothetical protein [Tanacetum cinerariifolium]